MSVRIAKFLIGFLRIPRNAVPGGKWGFNSPSPLWPRTCSAGQLGIRIRTVVYHRATPSRVPLNSVHIITRLISSHLTSPQTISLHLNRVHCDLYSSNMDMENNCGSLQSRRPRSPWLRPITGHFSVQIKRGVEVR